MNGDEGVIPSLSRTDLDSHANMVVVGKHAAIINDTGRRAEVSPFTPDYESLSKVPIVDAAIRYDCPYSGETYLLIVRNALSVPSMDHNLIPPFIIKEAGVDIKCVPKIQCKNPEEDDHSVYFKEENLRIPLRLHGVFSYFPSSKPSNELLSDCTKVLLLTPDGPWNPNTDVYSRNEDSMLDYKGEMIENKDRVRILMSEIEDDKMMEVSAVISEAEASLIDRLYHESHSEYRSIHEDLGDLLHDDGCVSRFKMSVGSTNPMSKEYLDDASIGIALTEASTDVSDTEDSLKENNDLIKQLIEQPDAVIDEVMASATHVRDHKSVSADMLSKIWRIDRDTAEKTLEITSQRISRSDAPSLSRNYPTNDRMLRYDRIDDIFYTDTFFSTKKAKKSSRGNTCCQIFVTDKGFLYVVPMKSKGLVPQAMKQFAKELGAPDAFVLDSSGEQTSQEVRQFCNNIGTALRVLEEGTPWSNRAELYIGLIKESVSKDMREADSPLVFWDYCTERRARVHNLTARNLFQLHGSNPHTVLTKEEGDISNLCQYGWYDWCYYRDHTNKFPFGKEVLGRVLGPARGEGNEMAQWILKANGEVVPRRTHRPLQVAERHSPVELKKREIFNEMIKRRWGDSVTPARTDVEANEDVFMEYEDDDEKPRIIPDIEESVDSTGRLINQQPFYDRLINAEVELQSGELMQTGKVIGRSVNHEGAIDGSYDDNPMLNSLLYDVEFPDGQVKEYSANLIAENMLTRVDSDGFSVTLLEAITDYNKDDTAVDIADKYVITSKGRRRLRMTTQGWKLKVLWSNGTESWIPLKDLKESNPVEVAEFAKARDLESESAFCWWVPYVLRKRDVIISNVTSRARKTTHKYGIEMPTDTEHAKRLDAKNGNTFWVEAIKKEMHDVGIAFEILEDNASMPMGYRKVTGHLVFDVKMNFTRKARWVLDGHKTPSPAGSTYAGVVSRESVRIAFTYAALNGVDIFAADIRNAYLQAPSSEKHFIICGPEFGLENVGKRAIIRRALYGGKAAGRDFRNHLRSCMSHLNFKPCLADPDVWMRPAIKSDGNEYYEYVLLYTDDALVVSENAESILRDELGKYFELKQESIGPPKLYLGGSVRKVTLDNGVDAWAFSSSQYVKAAVQNVEDRLKKLGLKLPGKAETPLRTDYRPELDVTAELGAQEATYYQSIIGVLRWMVELGRVDICLEVSMMSSHLALPREGHLNQVYHIFGYLKKYHNTELVFDPSDPVVDESAFERRDWASSEFGHLLEEKKELPPNMPQPRGAGFITRAKVDADHAADTITRRSRTGFIVYANCAPIFWYSKKQNSVESSSFGSEFMAMKACCEYLRGFKYRLQMMGIPCEGPSYVYGDNQSVLCNTTMPDSTLKKKSQSIAYHLIREGVARDEWRTTYVNTLLNEADLLTKTLSGEKRKGFVRRILHHIFRSC